MVALDAQVDGVPAAGVAADRVVVVGSGPVGVAFAEQLSHLEPHRPILLLGDEPWRPYDRVRLSSLLARELAPAALYADAKLERRDNVTVLARRRVVRVDRDAKAVFDQHANSYEYSKLVLATGSSPRVPPIPGIDTPGVFVFRSMSDAERLLARQVASRCTVVIGGGLLGLEAARAMLRFNTRVHVIEHESRLMFHQLDAAAATLLREHVERLGIEVHLRGRVQGIAGNRRPEKVCLKDGAEIDCDTVIVATGISPNKELARDAGIAVGRGIRVDDRMRTSDGDVYAIGECCEHRDVVYGLVGPGVEQAAVAASNIAGIAAEYAGSTIASSLKVVGCPVFSIGEIENTVKPFRSYVYRDAERYRRVNVYRGRVIGAVGFGDWDLVRLRTVSLEGLRVWPWQLRRFTHQGRLWTASSERHVASWAPEATICACRGVKRATLGAAIEAGAATVAALAERTGASTVCGSCSPLLADLLGAGSREAAPLPRTLLIGSFAGALLALLAYAIELPYAAKLSAGNTWEALWTTSFYRQLSGYSLLALGLFVSLLSLRKRIARFAWARFTTWQLTHVLVGAFASIVLFAHTGFRAGANLNFALMLCFTGLLLTGGIAGMATALARRRGTAPLAALRTAALWAHVLLLWPLPVLLGFHAFKGYYF